MATELMDEHEQGERVRAWLRENGAAIVTGVALGVAGLFGWQWWTQHQFEQKVQAAVQYEALSEAIQRRDRDAADALTASLVADFGRSPYAVLARLQQAELLLEAGQTASARDTLQEAAAQTRSRPLADLARVRLARVLIALEDPQAALQQLDAVAAGAYAAVVAELRGDALAALGRRNDAQLAYRAAVEALDPFSPGRRLVEMKLVDAGGTPPSMES
jgi:predicted negative regulator of RcsB-dependent stress response